MQFVIVILYSNFFLFFLHRGNLSGENLQKMATSAVTSVQTYSSALMRWATQLMASKAD